MGGGVQGAGLGGVDGWTEEQAQTNLPLNFFEVGASECIDVQIMSQIS